jgi:hypothetical protein
MTKIKTTLIAAALSAFAATAFAAGETKPMQLAATDKATMSEPAADTTVSTKGKKHAGKRHHKGKRAKKPAQ